MKQSKILLDTCSYFRLARYFHPLLNKPFGDQNYCLFIAKELETEYKNQPRLKGKFGEWFNEPEYVNNRKKSLYLSPEEKKSYYRTLDFILDSAKDDLENISLQDIRFLSYAYALNIPLVTDDGYLIVLAKEYNIKVYNSLELLKLMLDCKRISLEDIRNTVKYWLYIRDLPKGFKKDYKRLFKEDPPLAYDKGS